MQLTDFAAAKINLFLHVLSRRPDGYHELESLVAFADIGDRLTLDLSKPFSLQVTGPFMRACGDNEQNSVMKAARALQLRLPQVKLGAFTLEKNLPVAAGLGGGSADAAAALRLLVKANDLSENDRTIFDAAVQTGADVPVCLKSSPAVMRGVGEKLAPFECPPCAAVLANCGVPLSTRDVFAKLVVPEPRPPENYGPMRDAQGLINMLEKKTNDLADAARALCPQIVDTERALAGTNAGLVRLSGSGATVFALYKTRAHAEASAQKLRQDHPQWWVSAITLGKTS